MKHLEVNILITLVAGCGADFRIQGPHFLFLRGYHPTAHWIHWDVDLPLASFGIKQVTMIWVSFLGELPILVASKGNQIENHHHFVASMKKVTPSGGFLFHFWS